MNMKSILAITCLAVMVLANPIDPQRDLKKKVKGLIEEMNTTCANLKALNYSKNLIKKLEFDVNTCNKNVYQKTLCQVNGALKQLSLRELDTKGVINSSKRLLGGYNNCTLPEKSITVMAFCSDIRRYLQWLYNDCISKQ